MGIGRRKLLRNTRGGRVVDLSLGLMEAMERHWRLRVTETGMPRVNVQALWTLRTVGPMPMRGLADQLGLDPTQVTAVVDRLEEACLATRQAHPTDRRIKVVSLTDAGDTFLDRLADRLMDDAPPLRHLSDDELATLERLLAKALAWPEETG